MNEQFDSWNGFRKAGFGDDVGGALRLASDRAACTVRRKGEGLTVELAIAADFPASASDFNAWAALLARTLGWEEKVVRERLAPLLPKDLREHLDYGLKHIDIAPRSRTTNPEPPAPPPKPPTTIPEPPTTIHAGLVVRFPDGTVFAEKLASKTFAHTIEHIGPAKVAPLKLTFEGEPIVTRNRNEIQKVPSGVTAISNGWFVKTHSCNKDKVRRLEEISRRLDLSLEISHQERTK